MSTPEIGANREKMKRKTSIEMGVEGQIGEVEA